jgi:baculoviral IAP repeat-containing protein 6
LYTDGRGIGVRGDYNGVLLLHTILQMPVFRSEDIIKLEMLLTDAILLHHCLRSVELPGVDHVQEVLQELSTNIALAKTCKKKGIKAQKVSKEYYLIINLLLLKIIVKLFIYKK